MPGGLILSQPGAEEASLQAQQNPILRNYFRGRLSEAEGFLGGSSFPSQQFLEKFIDRQIDRYLSDLREKLDGLKSALKELEEAGAELQRRAPGVSLPIRQQWRKALGSVEKKAGDIRRMLGGVFTEIEDRDEFKPRINPQNWRSGFEEEQKYLNDQANKAEERITRYFFTSTKTIQQEKLQGENMLIHLYRVGKMAKALKRSW